MKSLRALKFFFHQIFPKKRLASSFIDVDENPNKFVYVWGVFAGFFYSIFQRRRESLRVLFVFLGTIILFLPWFVYMIRIGNTGTSLLSPSSASFFNVFSNFLFGFTSDHLNTIIVSFWPLSVLLGFLALRKNKIPPPLTVYMILTLLLSLLGVFVMSFAWKPLFLSRYLIITLPSLYLFLGWILFTYPATLSRVLRGAVIAIATVFLIVQTVSASVPVKENYQEASVFLNQNTSSGDVIVASSPLSVFPLEYYYHGAAALVTLPSWDRIGNDVPQAFNETTLPENATLFKKNYQRLWLVLSYDEGHQSEIKTYFDTHFEKLLERNFSSDLNVYLYKLNY